jgi:hypothetical protein
MDTLSYAVAATLNSVAHDQLKNSLVIPEPEFQMFNLGQLNVLRIETGNSDTRFNDHAHICTALRA